MTRMICGTCIFLLIGLKNGKINFFILSSKAGYMLSVTEQALEALREQIPNRNADTAIRIYVQGGCCSGPHLKICVDQVEDNDHIVDFMDLRFVVNRDLISSCGSMTVDFMPEHTKCRCSGGCGGFYLSGEKKFLFSERCDGTRQCMKMCKCDDRYTED